MDYAGELNALKPLYGYEHLGQLSRQRDSFKHHGLLPNVPEWHTVGERFGGYRIPPAPILFTGARRGRAFSAAFAAM